MADLRWDESFFDALDDSSDSDGRRGWEEEADDWIDEDENQDETGENDDDWDDEEDDWDSGDWN